MISSPTCLQETPLHAKENCARAWEFLGDHRIQQTRSDTTLPIRPPKGDPAAVGPSLADARADWDNAHDAPRA
jgi:hypothetical protein